ncbi:TrkH family potassium uptake protein [Candidatus Berkiella cookevillensis]|uniref:Trk system potassium uptake protein n=1 Tax=Candidatus Berkiella cookevillensis TaxID=437022 RepID=A0A0Q9YR26_9GAMM|nr:TrkH family potassium uptake protein [Candidatus Berkiella cookevillensis]MCS5707291.1 TrkH family potassium uptake protein [Candidatus Berkiella cookevillensis]
MQYSTIFRVLGLLLIILSLTLIPPLLIEIWFKDGTYSAFYLSFLTTFILGLITWFPFRKKINELRTRDGFLVVVLFWVMFCLVSAFPLYWSPYPDISFVDALFESVSGITTTGSTVLVGLDHMPHSILYYRQQLQFLGGIGIIILAVAVLPMLGVGGMQLFKAEFTGPSKDNKLTPRITETAKAIWLIYVFLNLVCILCYWLGGMDLFDAVCYAFATIATGGFAPHDASMGFYQSPFLKIMASLFMFLGAVSFNLHYWALGKQKFGVYSQDPELWFYIKFLLISFGIICITHMMFGEHLKTNNLIVDTIFQLVSLGTTTGFVSTDFSLWPSFIPILLLFCGVLGGCAGSTSGGIKVIRLLLLQKQGAREIRRLVHPRGQYVIKVGGKPVNPRVIDAIWGFLAIYITTFTVLLFFMLLTENDFYTAYTSLLGTISNSGPGLGKAAQNFSSFSDASKLILSIAMLMGRLEIFTIIVLFSPSFWRS